MAKESDSKRIRERLALQLPVRIHCREGLDFEWTEMTRLINVTPFGAGFTLTRPTEKGRLLHMTIPMPRQLRVFDHVEDQYRIWAIVRHLKSKTTDKGPAFEVGVAFIGKRAPASYGVEPWKRYEISCGVADKLAAIEETRSSADERVHTRHHIAVDMLVEMIDPKGTVVQSEQTVTENISADGDALHHAPDSGWALYSPDERPIPNDGLRCHSLAHNRRRRHRPNSRRVRRQAVAVVDCF